MSPDRGWPFVGRDLHVTRIIDIWRGGGRGVLIEGLPGMGKTRLADEAGAAVGASERLRIVGNPASRTRPYAAVAHLLGGDLTGDVVGRLCAALPAERTPLVVDEAGSLDDATVAALNHLLSSDRIMLIASARNGVAVPPALAALIGGHRLATIEVAALSVEEVTQAVTVVLGDALDSPSSQRLIELSGGNPLFVRELVLGAMSSGAVHRLPTGVRMEFDAPSNLRLLEVVGERIADLDQSATTLLRLVAIAESLGISDLEELGLFDLAADLERAGLLRVDVDDHTAPGGTVRIAHPLHGEVLRATMGKLEVRRQTKRAVDVLRRRAQLTPDDELRLAVWLLEVGDAPDIDVVVAGARRARAAMDLTSTLRLAQAADEARPSVATQTLIMEALFLQGDFVEAERVASRQLPTDIDGIELFTHTAIRIDNLLWGFGDIELARAVAAERRPTFDRLGMLALLDGLEAYGWAIGGRIHDARRLLGDEPSDGLTALLTAPARMTMLDRSGHLQEAIDASTRALQVLHRFPDPKAVMDPASFQVSRCLTLLALGRFDEARADATAAYQSVVTDGVPFLRAFLPIVLGRIELAQGRTDDAWAWFAESRSTADAAGVRTAERVAIAGLASTAGQRGDCREAQELLDALDAIDDPLGLMRVETTIGRAWALHAVGRPEEALASLRDIIVERGEEEPGPTMCALAEMARLGDAAWAADRLHLVAGVDGPYAAARRDMVHATASGNIARLEASAQALADLGSHALAAEAASVLASYCARAGDIRRAGAAETLAADQRSRCQALDTPLLTAGGAVPLSNREREVTMLAAAGLSSREIADQLHVSIRTVDNHLSRSYAKLGVTGRSELSEALRRRQTDD